MTYTIIHIIHIFSVFTYGGFLIVDKLFLSKMTQDLSEEEHAKAREAIMVHVRKVVPYALMVAVASGIYMALNIFGEVGEDGLTYFQKVLSLKIFLGLWLGARGINQKLFGINPFVFTGHLLPFIFVIVIIFLSQIMKI
jgi:hypothetical protein